MRVQHKGSETILKCNKRERQLIDWAIGEIKSRAIERGYDKEKIEKLSNVFYWSILGTLYREGESGVKTYVENFAPKTLVTRTIAYS